MIYNIIISGIILSLIITVVFLAIKKCDVPPVLPPVPPVCDDTRRGINCETPAMEEITVPDIILDNPIGGDDSELVYSQIKGEITKIKISGNIEILNTTGILGFVRLKLLPYETEFLISTIGSYFEVTSSQIKDDSRNLTEPVEHIILATRYIRYSDNFKISNIKITIYVK